MWTRFSRTFEFGNLTKGNEGALEHLKMALKLRFLWFLKIYL